MEVELLGPRPPGLTRSQPVFALHGPNAATELGAAALLQVDKPGADIDAHDGPEQQITCKQPGPASWSLPRNPELIEIQCLLLQDAQVGLVPLLAPLLAAKPRAAQRCALSSTDGAAGSPDQPMLSEVRAF